MEQSQQLAAGTDFRAFFAKIDFQAVAIWMLGFLLIVYLGLNGGGYAPVIRNQVGIAVWWGILLGLAVGALPIRRLRAGSWIALGLLAAYVAWVGLSSIWATAPARSVEDLGRVATYLGIFTLAISLRGSKGARRMITAVGAGIFVVAAVGLLSRLHPEWFPTATETVALLPSERNRLAYPLGYWNGVAELVAIGIPLILYLAGSSRRIAFQALSTAALPAMGLALYFTFSRTGTVAAVVGAVLFLALAHDRVPKTLTALIAAVGTAILVAAAHQRHALDAGLGNDLAQQQGHELLAIVIVVCLGAGLIQAALGTTLRYGRRPSWSRPSRRASLVALGGAAVVVVLAAVALGGPSRAADAWGEFKTSGGSPTGTGRLQSFGSSGRINYWSAAIDEFRSAPLVGEGSGSFEAWWAQHRTVSGGFVRDAHSLYLELLGELGVVGFALLVGFFGWIVAIGIRRYSAAAQSHRTQLGAALAGCAAFLLGAAFDWSWELAVVPIAFLLLASVLVSAGERPRPSATPLLFRLTGCAIAAVAMVAIAIPLSAAVALQNSESEFRAGNYDRALREAADAQSVEPFAAAPRLQQALVQEQQGNLPGAEAEALAAVQQEPQEWRAWVILSRIQAQLGKVQPSVDSYRKARALSPRSPLFNQ